MQSCVVIAPSRGRSIWTGHSKCHAINDSPHIYASITRNHPINIYYMNHPINIYYMPISRVRTIQRILSSFLRSEMATALHKPSSQPKSTIGRAGQQRLASEIPCPKPPIHMHATVQRQCRGDQTAWHTEEPNRRPKPPHAHGPTSSPARRAPSSSHVKRSR